MNFRDRGLAVFLLGTVAFLGRAQTPSSPLPEGPGRELFVAVCSTCHEPTKVLTQQMTKAQWKDKVLEMLQELPDVKGEESAQIVDYLAVSFPKKVNVNSATAAEIERIAELPAKDAAAIVRYRTANGSFKDLEDLKKVPGVDAAKLGEGQRHFAY
jgi:competence protein ComEA